MLLSTSLAAAFAAPLSLSPCPRPLLQRPSLASPVPRFAPADAAAVQVRRPRASLIPERPPGGYEDTCPLGSTADDFSAERVAAREAARYRGPLPVPPPPPGYVDPPLFVDEPTRQAFWQTLDVSETFAPVTPDEAARLRRILPRRLADFLLDRAADAERLRDRPDPDDDSFYARLLRDLPPNTPDWEDEMNAEFANYQYVTATGPPSFRRRGSSLFGGGDGLQDPDNDGYVGEPHDTADDIAQGREPIVAPDEHPSRQARQLSIFVGQSGSVDEQASRLGYSILAVLGLWIFIKLVLALVSFFVSFTFSFLAIFALSAGIFVVFFLLRF